MLNSPDWSLHIDARDAMGNTLLSIACQNNNKRIAKLCMRRGADINTQNVRAQTLVFRGCLLTFIISWLCVT